MACGALQLDAGSVGAWVPPRRSPGFLFPVHALSRVFRGKFVQATELAHCKLGRWRVVEQRGADRAAIAAPTIERPGRTHCPEPACAGLVAMRDRMAHRCAHQPRVASSPDCNVDAAPPSDAACVGVARSRR
ncbi:hypothetical protein [Methylibium sp.]|uniref:hypothetical protein n=1 Tax=Methylibium sp. TaxID=2067992 RepID=UPI0038F6BEAE